MLVYGGQHAQNELAGSSLKADIWRFLYIIETGKVLR
jgi:hypothetical protein